LTLPVPRALAAALLAPLLLAAKPVLPPLVIPVAADAQPRLPVRVKDQDLDIRLALSFDTALILNQAPAERAGLKPFPLIGKRTFQNAMIPGGEATFRFNLFGITPKGMKKKTVPVVWVSRPVAADGDGVLGLSVLQADRIVLDLGPQATGATVHKLTRPDKGSVIMKVRVGAENIRVALDLNTPDTVMNARAAAALAEAGLVRRIGDVGFWRPFPGVALPFERMSPVNGAKFLGLPLVRPTVRITEAQAKELDARARAGTSDAEDDEDAIVVNASRKKGRDPWILIGRDVLGDCSRIEFDRPGKAWLLTCAT
jgi:hypothetical protein